MAANSNPNKPTTNDDNDDDWDNGPDIEAVINEVLKTKTKRSQRFEEQRMRLRKLREQENELNNTATGNPSLKKNGLKQSISTPDLRHTNTKHHPVKTISSSVVRRFDFGSCTNLTEKENTHPHKAECKQYPEISESKKLERGREKYLEKNGKYPEIGQKYREISEKYPEIGQKYREIRGSSKVYKALDLERKATVAIKVVKLDGVDEETVKSYLHEVTILQTLQHSHRVIRLYDHEYTPPDHRVHNEDHGVHHRLTLVMEMGTIDLSTVIANARCKKNSSNNNIASSHYKGLSAFTIQHYWQGMLEAVQAIHTQGIIHSDLKPANFLLVNDVIKLIDFGIASSIQQDMTSVLKDSQAGTFNYMSPESLRDVHTGPIIHQRTDTPTIKINVKSDVWSLGCILYNMVYGHTPFQHIHNPLYKLSAISDPNTIIQYTPIEDIHLLNVMKICMQFDPRSRPSIVELLAHPYLSRSHGCVARGPSDAGQGVVLAPDPHSASEGPESNKVQAKTESSNSHTHSQKMGSDTHTDASAHGVAGGLTHTHTHGYSKHPEGQEKAENKVISQLAQLSAQLSPNTLNKWLSMGEKLIPK
ncbi:hypothetical protein Pmani_015130 [Petrolisthes manimaculis]|uniref:Protein kinase domain-containing protein n=1 Tax=Petrolisthes manimaculis TaxID=1843537 RepID=A0AAE1U7Z5_9EUCA|nr:hypothetical protein Pmani_015130 [Petrolisthes manimaculis]